MTQELHEGLEHSVVRLIFKRKIASVMEMCRKNREAAIFTHSGSALYC